MATKNAASTITNYINHVVFVLDESGSMSHLRHDVVKVFDGQIAYLAKRSQELGQETRVSVFLFSGSTSNCIIYDKDVLRLPSLAGLYNPSGGTPLIDATIDAITDLRMTPEKHGDHAFIAYVVTDGQENTSKSKPAALQKLVADIQRLGNWTLAVMVPDEHCMREAESFGFPKADIAKWDATSAKGLADAVKMINKATETFMQARASGKRSISGAFTLDLSAVNAGAVKGALVEVDKSSYKLVRVDSGSPLSIRDFVEQKTGRTYGAGMAFYQLMKPETIQDYKNVFVRERATGKIYGGDSARDVLGLPPANAKITPTHLGQFDVFIQSTSFNRKLVPGTDLLVLTT